MHGTVVSNSRTGYLHVELSFHHHPWALVNLCRSEQQDPLESLSKIKPVSQLPINGPGLATVRNIHGCHVLLGRFVSASSFCSFLLLILPSFLSPAPLRPVSGAYSLAFHETGLLHRYRQTSVQPRTPYLSSSPSRVE